jgi:phosphate transport system substrate-binding protein
MLGIKTSSRTALFAVIVSLLPHNAMAAETLRIGGTGAINETVKSLAPLFTAETGVALQLIPSMGTSGGNSAVADGLLDVSISGRPLKDSEVEKGLKIIAEFRTPFGMVTSHAKAASFKSAEVAQQYQSDKPLWSDGTPIRIILRPSNESDTQVLGQMFPGMTAAIAKVRTRADLSVAATDQDNADLAEKTPGSLVGATLTQIKMEKRNLQFVAIDGVQLSLEAFEKGVYPYGKTLYAVVGATPKPTAARFVAFMRTSKGISALREAGILLAAE